MIQKIIRRLDLGCGNQKMNFLKKKKGRKRTTQRKKNLRRLSVQKVIGLEIFGRCTTVMPVIEKKEEVF
jgi:hypothetical protein